MIRPWAEGDSLSIEDFPWSASECAESLRSPHVHAWLYAQDRPLGAVLTQVVVDQADLLTIGVAPRARRNGVAGDLLLEVERFWQEQGVVRAHLEVRATNVGAIALYEGRGWVRTRTRATYYKDGTDAWLMEWSQ